MKAIVKTATAALVGCVLALTQAGSGHADPSPAEIEAQIDAKWQQLEPIMEQGNKLRGEIAANQTKTQQLAQQLKPLETKVNAALDKVSAYSVYYYKGGNTSTINSLLATGSPQVLSEQLSLLDYVAHDEMSRVKEALNLKKQYEAEKKPLDALLAQQVKQQADLTAKENTINAEVKNLSDLRKKAYGTTVAKGGTTLGPCPVDYLSDVGTRVAKAACAQIGKSYVWATAGPDTFDCSGLMMYAWSQVAGVKLRHYTVWQYEDTKRVTRDQLRPGDLVFYFSDNHHVGMYVGGGYIVHAPNSGDVVRMKEVDAFPIYGYGRPST